MKTKILIILIILVSIIIGTVIAINISKEDKVDESYKSIQTSNLSDNILTEIVKTTSETLISTKKVALIEVPSNTRITSEKSTTTLKTTFKEALNTSVITIKEEEPYNDSEFENFFFSSNSSNYLLKKGIDKIENGIIYFVESDPKWLNGNTSLINKKIPLEDFNPLINENTYIVVKELVTYAKNNNGYVMVFYHVTGSYISILYSHIQPNEEYSIEYLSTHADFELKIYELPIKNTEMDRVQEGLQEGLSFYQWKVNNISKRPDYLKEQGFYDKINKYGEPMIDNYSLFDYVDDEFMEAFIIALKTIYPIGYDYLYSLSNETYENNAKRISHFKYVYGYSEEIKTNLWFLFNSKTGGKIIKVFDTGMPCYEGE